MGGIFSISKLILKYFFNGKSMKMKKLRISTQLFNKSTF